MNTNNNMILKCQRCGHEWDYKGKSGWWCSCPQCRTGVNIKKQHPEGVSDDSKT
jgi:predicted  nucleic acid-binding Zn-ribbon protein